MLIAVLSNVGLGQQRDSASRQRVNRREELMNQRIAVAPLQKRLLALTGLACLVVLSVPVVHCRNPAVAITVDAGANRHPSSPAIYGARNPSATGSSTSRVG